MELGLVTCLTGYGIDATTLARAAEERGFAALMLTEHTHIPTSRESPWPGGAEHGDGWIPLRIPPAELDPFAARVAELQRRAGEQGCSRLSVTVYGGVATADALAGYAAAGVDRVLFELPDADTDTVLRKLDELAPLLT